ncbi:hypothetical protein [Pantoea eucalypti]|uniref:hypothetical protein n=1 Tax=Pantoea eucalypti TaxID=470933 RepID=UPI002898B6B2|nr:hypothetical protein [Pantoea eucalypti]
MQNREAAEHITDSLLALAKHVTTSVNKIDVMNREGKVSPKEAALYRQSVLGALDKILTENLTGIFEQHPELRPRCSCCEPPHEEKDHD